MELAGGRRRLGKLGFERGRITSLINFKVIYVMYVLKMANGRSRFRQMDEEQWTRFFKIILVVVIK